MGIGTNHIDRLLPRHESTDNIDIDWHVRQAREGLFRKVETSTPATIKDISLEGALVEVASKETHEVGDHVILRFQGIEGEAVIRHTRKGDGDTTLYGVKLVRDNGFKDAIDITVGEIRGHSSELRMAWQKQN